MLFSFFYWDPRPEIFTIPYLNLPILWYGLLFAMAFIFGSPIFKALLARFFSQTPPKWIVDRISLYMIVATVVGARLGHFLFYERPSLYLRNPIELFKTWEGGLASHGAAIAIVFAVWLFARRHRERIQGLTWLSLLDLIAIPTALGGAFIRIGNFVNQEILGTTSSMPWAVVFGHPADHSFPAPRHPVQLYEALCYVAIFWLLWRLSFRASYLHAQGKLIGLFLVLVFGCRLLVEHWKEEQSHLVPQSFDLTMGQLLSLPAILVGLALFFRKSSVLFRV